MIIGRTANITVPHNDRTNCQYRNKCWLGCPFGAYFSTQSATLPAAVKTGNLTLRPWSIVTKILYDRDRKKATGVEVLDTETHKIYEYKAKIVGLWISSRITFPRSRRWEIMVRDEQSAPRERLG